MADMNLDADSLVTTRVDGPRHAATSLRERNETDIRSLRSVLRMDASRVGVEEQARGSGRTPQHLPLSKSDGLIPRFAWPFSPNCRPDRQESLPLRISGLCRDSRHARIRMAHYDAYNLMLTAYRTVRYIKFAPIALHLRQVIWNWGSADGYAWMWTDENGVSQTAREASLAHWFGPFSKDRLDTIYNILAAGVEYYEKGPEVWGTFKGVKYYCRDYKRCVAYHPNRRSTTFCRQFWDRNRRGRALIVLHENMHSVLEHKQPRDESFGAICEVTDGDGNSDYRCYADHTPEYDGANPWEHGSDDNDPLDNPRKLILGGAFNVALNNIDNYVSWIVRRWDNPQFRSCDAPRRASGPWDDLSDFSA